MKVSFRQLGMMTFLSFIAVKLLALPATLYETSGNMSWLVMLVLMLIDFFYALLIVDLMQKNQDKNIYEFMNSTVGPVLTKLLLTIFIIKYALNIANIGKSLELFILENLYDDLSWVLYGIPLIIVSSFMIYKGARNIGRTIEFFLWPIIIGCIYIGVKSFVGVDVMTYLPLFKDGVVPLLESGYGHLVWFGSSTFLFMFFGTVDFSKGKKSLIIKYGLLAILVVQFLLFMFYGLFDETSAVHQFAISDISQFVSEKSSVGELSWLVVSIWIIGLLLSFCLYGYALQQGIKYLFNIKNEIIPIVIIDLYIVIWGVLYEKMISPEKLFFTEFASWTTIISEYFATFVLLLGYAVRCKKDRRHKANETA